MLTRLSAAEGSELFYPDAQHPDSQQLSTVATIKGRRSMRNLTTMMVLLVLLTGSPLLSQTVPALTTQEVLGRNINGSQDQQRRSIPHRIAGNLYYVGTETLASFLVTTAEGHILINTNFESSVPLIQDSVERLGFSFQDVRIVLASHGHRDHVEGNALVKAITNAQVMIMAEDVPVVEQITPGDKPHPVDRALNHLDEVTLGDTTLIAHLTPAHTPGCTTWTLQVTEGGRSYDVVIQGCGLGTGRLVDAEGAMTDEVDQYIASFRYLRSLPCDIFLAAHGPQYNLMAKYQNIGSGENPFVDPMGYLTELDNWEKFFIAQLSNQVRSATRADERERGN
jgi:metallo-beta-lactamase class B